MGVGDDVAQPWADQRRQAGRDSTGAAAFRDACRKDGITTVRAVGTAAFRDAPNGSAWSRWPRGLGIQMEIATEKRESELAYLVGSLGQDGYAVIDNGSRSIELVAKDSGCPLSRLQPGYRVAYDQFFAGATDPARHCRVSRSAACGSGQASFMRGRKKLIGVEFGEMVGRAVRRPRSRDGC